MFRATFTQTVRSESSPYPTTPPFDPPTNFPETQAHPIISKFSAGENSLYASVRTLLSDLGLDRPNFGSAKWNPLGAFVTPGQKILIKPNLVTHIHPEGPKGISWTISHPSILRALVDYALLAVGLSGSIVIGDTPIENCDFNELGRISGLSEMVSALQARGYTNLSLIDFRTYQTDQYPDSSFVTIPLKGDPLGYTDIDLGESSCFNELESKNGQQNYYTLSDHSVDQINPKTRQLGSPNKFHHPGRHTYRIPNTVLSSDLVISVAKLKTHKFSGVTLCLKNAIGICQGKEHLPHRRPGTIAEGGDSFPTYPSSIYTGKLRFKRALFRLIGGKRSQVALHYFRKIVKRKPAHKVYSEPLYGDWHGNDTIWRTTLDLNTILLNTSNKGVLHDKKARHFLGVIDGVIGMDHEAPMTGLPVNSNLLIAGTDPAACDTLGAKLMGFDPSLIPTIEKAHQNISKFFGHGPVLATQIPDEELISKARIQYQPTKGWKRLLSVHETNSAGHN